MSNFKGDFSAGRPVRFTFNSNNVSGIPASMSGPTASVYKDNNTTESNVGLTITTDFDGRPGLNLVEIQTSGDSTFYVNGSVYDVILTAGSVTSIQQSGVGVGSFSLNNTYPSLLGVWNSGHINSNETVLAYVSGKADTSTYSNALDTWISGNVFYVSGKLNSIVPYDSSYDQWLSGNVFYVSGKLNSLISYDNSYDKWLSGNIYYISGQAASSIYSSALDLYISGKVDASTYSNALDTWISGNIFYVSGKLNSLTSYSNTIDTWMSGEFTNLYRDHAWLSGNIYYISGQTNIILADTNELQTDWHDSGRLDAFLDTIGTYVNSTYNYLFLNSASVQDNAPTTSSFKTNLASGLPGWYNDTLCVFTAGALSTHGPRPISNSYWDGSSARTVLEFDESWTQAPASGNAFVLMSFHIHPVSQIQSGLATQYAVISGAYNPNYDVWLSGNVAYISGKVNSATYDPAYDIWLSGNMFYVSGQAANSIYNNALDLYISGRVNSAVYDPSYDIWLSGNVKYVSGKADQIYTGIQGLNTEISNISGHISPVRHSTALSGTINSIYLDTNANDVEDFYAQCVVIHNGQARFVDSYSATYKQAFVKPNWVTIPSGNMPYRMFAVGAVDEVETTLLGDEALAQFANTDINIDYDSVGAGSLATLFRGLATQGLETWISGQLASPSTSAYDVWMSGNILYISGKVNQIYTNLPTNTYDIWISGALANTNSAVDVYNSGQIQLIKALDTYISGQLGASAYSSAIDVYISGKVNQINNETTWISGNASYDPAYDIWVSGTVNALNNPVYIYPLGAVTPDPITGTNITYYVGEVRSTTLHVVDSANVEVDLRLPLELLIEANNGYDLYTIPSGDMVIGGSSYNQCTFVNPSSVTDEPRLYAWSLRDYTGGLNRVLARGQIKVEETAS